MKVQSHQDQHRERAEREGRLPKPDEPDVRTVADNEKADGVAGAVRKGYPAPPDVWWGGSALQGYGITWRGRWHDGCARALWAEVVAQELSLIHI